jgi:hypothetical protein
VPSGSWPKNEANRLPTGGSSETRRASWCGTPCDPTPRYRTPGRVEDRWIPRKMTGGAIITIDWLMTAIEIPSVVFDRAIHL